VPKIKVSCSRCRAALLVDEKFAGRSGKCPHCQGILKVPTQNPPVAMVRQKQAITSPAEEAAWGLSSDVQDAMEQLAQEESQRDPSEIPLAAPSYPVRQPVSSSYRSRGQTIGSAVKGNTDNIPLTWQAAIVGISLLLIPFAAIFIYTGRTDQQQSAQTTVIAEMCVAVLLLISALAMWSHLSTFPDQHERMLILKQLGLGIFLIAAAVGLTVLSHFYGTFPVFGSRHFIIPTGVFSVGVALIARALAPRGWQSHNGDTQSILTARIRVRFVPVLAAIGTVIGTLIGGFAIYLWISGSFDKPKPVLPRHLAKATDSGAVGKVDHAPPAFVAVEPRPPVANQMPPSFTAVQPPQPVANQAPPQHVNHAGKPPEGAVETEMVGLDGGGPYIKINQDKLTVIGFAIRIGNWAGHTTLGHVEPLYEKPADPPPQGTTICLAKDGYVVGGITVNKKDGPNGGADGFQVIFMKKTAAGADVNDQYLSPWFGYADGSNKMQLAGHGERVIGTFGQQGLNMNKIGLILDGSSVGPAK